MIGAATAAAADLQVLFLGDNGPHRPRERFDLLEPVLRERGIELTYTDQVTDLNADKLGEYDALVLYANIDRIDPDQAQALLDYVAGGGGFVPLHCASFCFRNSVEVVALIGAQFRRHGWETMRDTVVEPDHPINRGYSGFESLDETYVHHLHNDENRLVLAYREDGGEREPWTWVRWHGDGRVFYTAWGHDHNTWQHPGFHNLVERGIRWAAGQDPAEAGNFSDQAANQPQRAPFVAPQMTRLPAGPPPFEHVDVGAKIPNYVPGTQGEPLTKMQLPLPAEESMKRIVVPTGFHVELFAADPDIAGKPICMTWDERGRLWVGESMDYPNELRPPGQGRDRIRICEDTTGDGRADKFTIFAENLSIPTSIAFAHGGVIVHDGTQTLFLQDTDGDDRADQRRVLFGTWDMRDTHGGPSNMQYGLDNWIWGMQGYNASTITIGDKSVSFRQGFHRFRPDGSDIEFIRSTSNNTWGYGTSEEGIIFGSTANGVPSVYMPIPNRYYERVRGWTPSLTLQSIADTHHFQPITERVRQVDWHGGYTAGAGHALYTARTYPEQWWNRTAFVCGPTGHLVGTFVLMPDGSDFHSTSPNNLLASDDEWTAPIMAEVGPDGNVWVIDWYNYIVQHNPTPTGFTTGPGNAYESDLRDKKHGRIYRVVYSEAPESRPVDLTRATPADLVATLAHDNLFWRRHAQRLLVERGEQDVVPQLIGLVADTSTDAIGLNVGAIHALWTLHGLGAIDNNDAARSAAVAALRHPSAGVRRNAVQVLPYDSASVRAILDAGLLDDPDAQVRLMTLLALADLPADPASAAAVAEMIGRPENARDRWIPDAATSAGATQGVRFLQELAQRGSANQKVAEIARIVAEHVARATSPDSLNQLLVALPSADRSLAAETIAGLSAGWPSERSLEIDPAGEEAIFKLLETLPLAARGALLKLGLRWQRDAFKERIAQLADALLDQLRDEDAPPADRIAAARQLVDFAPQDSANVELLLEVITPQTDPVVARGVMQALELSEVEEAGQLLLEHLEGQSPSLRAVGIGVLLERPTLTAALLDALESGEVRLTELDLTQRRTLIWHRDNELRERAAAIFARGGAIVNANRQKVIDDLASVAEETGDVVAGQAVYEKHCATCHVHAGVGTHIGPDLSGMAVHPKSELMVHILDPSRDLESNFRQYTVRETTGRMLVGMLAGESAAAIELVDAEGKRHVILRDDVEELHSTNISFMPDGFEQLMSRRELVDLLEFLTTPGKYLPLDLRTAANVSTDQPMSFRGARDRNRLVFDDWGPKTVGDVQFSLIDPQDGRLANAVVLDGGRRGQRNRGPRRAFDSVEIACNAPARAIHLLSGVSRRGYPDTPAGTVSMTVRLHYIDGSTEDHPLENGVHFANFMGREDVPESQRAFTLGDAHLRYLSIEPQRSDVIRNIELVRGDDRTAPIVMAVTAELP